jgi:hypothetical protein
MSRNIAPNDTTLPFLFPTSLTEVMATVTVIR